MGDTLFSAFGFPSTGGTANRTMPDRLAEIKNVLDFGADPTGVADSTSSIQAAVDWTAGANRGTIYFPIGFYKTTAPITYNYAGDLSIRFLGEIGTVVNGNFSGYIFDRHLPTATVTISNASPGVVTDTAHGLAANTAIRFEVTVIGGLPAPLTAGTTYYVKTVLSANTYTVSATSGGTAINTTTAGSGTITRAFPNTTGGRIFERMSITNNHASGGGIRIGSTDGGVIRDCLFSNWINVTTEDAVGVSSSRISITANAFTNNGTTSGSHHIIIGGGGVIEACQLSGAETAVRAYGKCLFINGNRSERCDTSWLLGLDSGGNNVGLSGWSLTSCSSEGDWTAYDLAGLCSGFVMAGSGSVGHDSFNAGVVPFIQPSQYGIRIRANCARDGVIQSTQFSEWFDQAAIAIEDSTTRANLVFRELTAKVDAVGSVGVNWLFPSNAYTAQFYNNNAFPLWTFSQLPTGGNVLEGDEFDITDANTTTWGANVTSGGGSSRIRVRYNGTNWTVVGK